MKRSDSEPPRPTGSTDTSRAKRAKAPTPVAQKADTPRRTPAEARTLAETYLSQYAPVVERAEDGTFIVYPKGQYNYRGAGRTPEEAQQEACNALAECFLWGEPSDLLEPAPAGFGPGQFAASLARALKGVRKGRRQVRP